MTMEAPTPVAIPPEELNMSAGSNSSVSTSSSQKSTQSSPSQTAEPPERSPERLPGHPGHKEVKSSEHKEVKSFAERAADHYKTTVQYKDPVEDLAQKILNAEKAATKDSIDDFKIQDDCCFKFLKSCPCPCGGGIVADLAGFICFPLSIFSLLSCLCFKCPFSCFKSKTSEAGTVKEASSEVKNGRSTSDGRSQEHHHVERRSASEGSKE